LQKLHLNCSNLITLFNLFKNSKLWDVHHVAPNQEAAALRPVAKATAPAALPVAMP
jgi:hypothetical protein